MKNNNTLSGGLPVDFMESNMTSKDVYFYNYPSNYEMKKSNLILYI